MSDLSISSCSPVDYDLLQHATDAYMDPDSDGPNCEVLAAISLALENRPRMCDLNTLKGSSKKT